MILAFFVKVGNDLDANSLNIHKKTNGIRITETFSHDRGW